MMLTSDDIRRSEQLTEEYGSGRDQPGKYPDPTNVFEAIERRQERQQLEHSLATTFIAQQKESIPAERTRLWNRCLELVTEIERLNDE